MWVHTTEQAVAELVYGEGLTVKRILAALRFFAWLSQSAADAENLNLERGIYLYGLMVFCKNLEQYRPELLASIDPVSGAKFAKQGSLGFANYAEHPDGVPPGYSLFHPYSVHAAHVVDFYMRASTRMKPSLNKAFIYLYGGHGLNGLDQYARPTFDIIWKTHKRIAPFLWVDMFHTRLFGLDPSDEKSFVGRISENLQGDRFRNFFGASKWCVERFIAQIDPRSLNNLDILQIPQNLPAIPVRIQKLRTADLKRMQRELAERSPKISRHFECPDDE